MSHPTVVVSKRSCSSCCVCLSLWHRYARAQLRDGATLDALCNRLDALLVLVDDCVNKYGASAVIDDLDTVSQPCDGRCNFNAHTAKAFV